MEKVQAAFAQVALHSLPDNNQLSAINGRIVQIHALKVDDLQFPELGTFAPLLNERKHQITVTLKAGTLTFSNQGQTLWTLTPTTVDLFWQRRAPASGVFVGGKNTLDPVFHSILHLVAASADFYLRIPGAKAAHYLLGHPNGLPLRDVLNIKQISYHESEIELTKAINAFGYSKLIANTELAFFDDEQTISL
ncbi:hypothetical protein [Lacticaseibacillus manihotivorans]|uniref:Uncharacterized protein n=2 Tax=Lacticaseibacillus manihotivorans TaxID=88233 RepID=A0A0R1QR30_9LACO|nr:hypothetical protein [Lacticaseibacillus manihotivorans]KRL44514.1 hypothetical protein FD01_GL001090 [Lacticaseibacillus manihotivorans DSM 13343 = JCM 12514]QFQ92671.1 hypothetical protein LM010_15295 [Lacticaseibacillus manihotivorans]